MCFVLTVFHTFFLKILAFLFSVLKELNGEWSGGESEIN